MTMPRLPIPLDHERAYAASVLLLGAEVLDACPMAPADFGDPCAAAIVRAAAELTREGHPADLLSICDALDAAGELERCGGRAGITEAMTAAVPSAALLEPYGERIRDAAKRRRLIVAAHAAQAAAARPDMAVADVQRDLETALQEPGRSGNYSRLGAILPGTLSSIQARTHGELAPGEVRTGFANLDDIVGAFKPGDLVVIAARPSIGKSAFALNLIERAAVPCGLFSLEMPAAAICQRLLAARARVDSRRLATGRASAADWVRIEDAAGWIDTAPLYIDDTAGLPLADLEQRARRMVRVEGAALLVVDYLQLIRHNAGRGRSRENEVAEVSAGLKRLAKTLTVPVVVLCQLNRQAEADRPRLSHLRESGAIEQDADVVILLHRARQTDNEPAEGTVAKNRNGPTGVARLAWRGDVQRFEDRARNESAV